MMNIDHNCCVTNDRWPIYCGFMDIMNLSSYTEPRLNEVDVFRKEITALRTPLSYDLLVVSIVAVVVTVARVLVQRVFLWVAKRGFVRIEVTPGETMESRSVKFSESCWKIIFYTLSMGVGWWLCFENRFMDDPGRFWTRVHIFATHDAPKEIRWFYMFAIGSYVSMMFAHVFIEVRRKDFWVMLSHHCTTVLLLGWSWVNGCCDVGVAVLALHDVNDVLLEMGKTLSYIGRETIATGVFAVFVVCWVFFRLYLFPFHVIYSCLYDGPRIAGCFNGWLELTGLLLFLMPMHIYWFWLIMLTLVNILRGIKSDPREDHDEDDLQTKKKTN